MCCIEPSLAIRTVPDILPPAEPTDPRRNGLALVAALLLHGLALVAAVHFAPPADRGLASETGIAVEILAVSAGSPPPVVATPPDDTPVRTPRDDLPPDPAPAVPPAIDPVLAQAPVETPAPTPQPVDGPATRPARPKKPAATKPRVPVAAHADSRQPASAAADTAANGDPEKAASYIALVAGRIRGAMIYPDQARLEEIEGVARARFVIGGDGRVGALQLIASSGSATIDGAALAAVKAAGPFPPPPAGHAMDVTVPLRFRLRDMR